MNLTTTYSLWLAPLCVLLGIGLAWWLYGLTPEREGFSRKLALVLATCRAIAVALLAFFLLEPMVRILVREVRKPVVVLLHDGSSSLLAAGDTAALRSRYPEELERLEDGLRERFDVRTFTYGEGVAEGITFAQQAALTDVDGALREVYDRFNGPDLGAVIIDGDGIYNRGRDPRSTADALGVPVMAIALGDTTVRPDLVLHAVEHNRIGYLGNELPLLVRVEGRRLAGTSTRISVLHAGKEVVGKEVVFNGRSAFLELPFAVKPERAGMLRYSVQVRPVQGEVTELNNRADILIEVLDDRQRVLLLGAAPHPDLGALRQALAGLEGYGVELAFAADVSTNVSEFDLLVLHGLPTPKYPVQTLLQKADAAGIPICHILTSGMDFNAFNARGTGVQLTVSRGATTDAQASVNKDFSFFTLDPEQVRTLERYPPLQVPFGQFEMGRLATALAEQRIGMVRTRYPLIAMAQQQERRSAVIAGEGIWRWRINDMQQHGDHTRFDRLIHKLVQFLALKVNKERFRVEHAPRFSENESVVLTAESYNATLEPVNDAEVVLTLTDDQGRDFLRTFSPSGTGYRTDLGRLAPGTYTWTARTTVDGISRTASGELHVEALVAEQLSTVADRGLWNDLAARSNGLVVEPGGTEAIVNSLLERPDLVARSYAHPSYSDLIGLQWLFFVVLGLLTCEWVLRRRNGAY